MKNMISFVCTTYRRFECVKRIIAQYYAQSYYRKELIILNTDIEHPYSLDFKDANIKIINQNIDFLSGKPYTNRGQICRDAVMYATGDYFMLADDDDIYLPWHFQQAIEEIFVTGKDAWKPEYSFFALPDKLEVVKNTLEASVIVKMNRIREIGFRTDETGYEGLSWYTKLRDEGHIDENNKNYVPSYCFNWGDPQEMAGHKQSGAIGSPNNFENHKEASKDYATRSIKLEDLNELHNTYKPYYDYFREHKDRFNQKYYERYVIQYL